MDTHLIIAITINMGILLIGSWAFGAYIFIKLNKQKKQLQEQLKQPQPQTSANSQTTSPPKNDAPPADLWEELAEELREKEDRISHLMNIKENHLTTQELINTLNIDGSHQETVSSHLENLDSDYKNMEHIISSLEKDLESSQDQLESMKKELDEGEGRLARIAGLEKSERRMRDENKKLRKTQTTQGDDLNSIKQKNKHLLKKNDRLKRALSTLVNASNEQLEVIKKLHAEIERAAKLEEHQQQLINDLEKRLQEEKASGNDLKKVEEMEKELEKLQDTLKRTLIEKEFIEEHMVEMDDSLEKARETEAALERARREIETLEKHFPEFEPDTPKNKPQAKKTATPPSPTFTSDIPEINNIIEFNRLFGSLQEFWSTLDTPPLSLTGTQRIDQTQGPYKWIRIDIGDKDYTVLLTMSGNLAEIVTKAIFKESGEKSKESELKDATGELGNVIAGTLATEMDNNFAIGIPLHIDDSQAETWLSELTLVSEMLATSKSEPIYVALLTY